MPGLEEHEGICPYCGEPITLLLDLSQGSHVYVEDCQVCCRPINISITEHFDGSVSVSLLDENSTF
ncbi:CPXCG motif-containing cysteine-rich protein [Microbulbifer guangxiensis]|uniref:CPXCG motif-containing cysteine-rich protein n=1 Tax=Microbulbifer guangxiensis TaxID=2904249 RepID=UPI0021030A64|nr:CPXCG motif-containing cysteine-rich protein [Microbulbifer guangxiensis]